MSLEFLSVERGGAGTVGVGGRAAPEADGSVSDEDTGGEGGDPACWAALLCPECGGVAGDGSGHWPGCANAPSTS
jgi:hypothetical protein